MAAPFAHEDLEKLKKFIEFVSANPLVLTMPELAFVRKFIEKFGGTVPAGNFQMPAGGETKCPFGGDAKSETKAAPEPEEEDESEESELELDTAGVIEPDNDVDQPMGDSSKTPSEEDVDKSSEFRSQAAAAYSEQKYQEAIDLYSQAIEINPGNALFHAKRGQAFLKLEKPNACIRDCNKALEINCDSAAAYKFRGRANRLLGNWEEAAKDLRQACRLDYDEETDEWLREVTPNAKKIEQHIIKQQRKKAERQRKADAKRREKARAQAQNSASAGPTGGFPGGAGGFPGGFPGNFADAMGGMNIEEIMSCFNDPEIKAAMQDIMMNKGNIDKYKNHPKISKHIERLRQMGLIPGAGSADDDDDIDADPTPPPKEDDKPKEAPKKPDFADDGLD